MKVDAEEKALSRVAVCAMAVLLVSCGSSLPEPEFAPQPQAEFEEVESSPPPARAEIVPPRPRSNAVWIDGEWSWDGRRWAWEYGRWVVAPRDARYAKWAAMRRADGILLVAPGSWRNAAGAELVPPRALAIAKAPAGSVVDVEGQNESTAPNVSPEGTPQAK
jgi:hypothetical protein